MARDLRGKESTCSVCAARLPKEDIQFHAEHMIGFVVFDFVFQVSLRLASHDVTTNRDDSYAVAVATHQLVDRLFQSLAKRVPASVVGCGNGLCDDTMLGQIEGVNAQCA